MKWLWSVLVRGFIIGAGLGLFLRLYADTDVSVGVNISAPADFYAPLTPGGVWVDVGNYGHCWRPAHVEAGWRPYCEGEWVWSDDGWYWESDEPWAWACYHYGSWVYVDDNWYWVPGTVWAPAWVEWRVGGGYCGWAPCGPPGFVIVDANFVFCDEHHFGDRHHRGDVIVNNTTIINKTKIINKTEVHEDGGHRRVGRDDGPKVADIQKATGKKFTPRPVAELNKHTMEKAPKEIRDRKPSDENNAQGKGFPAANDDHTRNGLKPDDKKPDFKPDEKLPKHEDITPPDHPTHITPPDVNGPVHTAPDHPLKDITPGTPHPGGPPVVNPHHEGPGGGGPPVHEGGGEPHGDEGKGKDKP